MCLTENVILPQIQLRMAICWNCNGQMKTSDSFTLGRNQWVRNEFFIEPETRTAHYRMLCWIQANGLKFRRDHLMFFAQT